ncbi:MAG: sulfurtransferase [Alphaproteobacteria bacterium]|nr:sulfurtransferase [Alphaproteobacteria bacterium]
MRSLPPLFCFLACLFLFPVIGIGALAQTVRPIVDAEWLARNHAEPGLVVIDVRDAEDFRQSHIPGSINADYADTPWRFTGRRGVPMVPSPEDFAGLVAGFGVSTNDHVVVVAAGRTWTETAAATDVYWTFKRMGHRRVSILDGGFLAYRAAIGAPVSQGQARPRPRVPYVVQPNDDLAASRNRVLSASRATVLIDARLQGDYLGINRAEWVARYGTIPGAKNLPANWLTTDGRGSLRDTAEYVKILEHLQIDYREDMITFGNGSQTGSLAWFVLFEVLGNRRTRLYAGGMADWAADRASPVERRINLD